MSPTRLALVLAALAIDARTVRADEPPPTVSSSETQPPEPEPPLRPPGPPKEKSAADVASVPSPEDSSGRTDQEPGDSALRVVGRALLFFPKLAVQVATFPVRGTLWTEDRFHVDDLYYRTFWNEDRTIGLYPTASYSTGFGIVAGLRFEDKDMFGAKESLAIGAAWGGTYRTSEVIKFRTGNRFGSHVQLGLDANFDRLPSDPFYGIGNSNQTPAPDMLIDPQTNSTAVSTNYRWQEARVAAGVDFRIVGAFHVIVAGALADIKTSPSTVGTPIDTVYNPNDLVGFNTDVNHISGYGELRYDTRRAASVWEPRDVHGEGTLLSVLGGPVGGFSGSSSFWHYAGEAQQYFHLGTGPRVFLLRFHGEGVTGNVDQVPFVELPSLGGDAFLRGYSYQRWRDRVAAVATAQYGWDLAHNVGTYLFVDAGRVYPSVSDITLSGLRAGFGLGLEFYANDGSFWMETSLASSIDGGLVVSLSFNPVLDARPRWK